MMVIKDRMIPSAWLILSLLTTCSNAFIGRAFVVKPNLNSNAGMQAIRNHQLKLCASMPPTAAAAADAYNVDDQQLDDCPRGYYLDSANARCNQLGPLGRVSQIVERVGPLKRVSRTISNLFGIDQKKISSLGVTFALSYSIISNINGSISLSVAWYMSCQRTGLSPLAPGQWKSLLKAYGTLYAVLQLLRPFRVATAIAMSKLSGEFLQQTQDRLDCSRAFAIVFQYVLGLVAWVTCAAVGITVASVCAGVPLWKAI